LKTEEVVENTGVVVLKYLVVEMHAASLNLQNSIRWCPIDCLSARHCCSVNAFDLLPVLDNEF